ncbi:thioredoxin O, mitochondrial-like [Phragmites australis]|uniref:thioredoxin O, mitochondrial-like n=1 Tax=Phragmites australis TaxID=29695 RepID=UPI002D77ADF4|nr:thioredoxin O, mitochondrial-like [Phragmites australis]
MARRLCRLPRFFPLAAAASKPHPHLVPFALNPNPAPLLPSFSRPPPSLPTLSRLFSSSAGGSSMVVVGSADSFTSVLSKVQDEKLPAVFYYTAVWCGPCRAIAPVISKLSSRYPNIPVYKVDIDMEGLGSKLGDLKIFSVPTFHFYHKGQKTSEIVGADVKKLEAAMESLHKQQ